MTLYEDHVVIAEMDQQEIDQRNVAPLIRDFLKRDAEYKRKRAELSDLKSDLDDIKNELFELMARLGWSSLKVDGRTVYLHRQLWSKVATGATKEDFHEALKQSGYEDLVYETTNSNQVSAVIREIAKNLELESGGIPPSTEEIIASLPPALRATLEITERHDVRAKKA